MTWLSTYCHLLSHTVVLLSTVSMYSYLLHQHCSTSQLSWSIMQHHKSLPSVTSTVLGFLQEDINLMCRMGSLFFAMIIISFLFFSTEYKSTAKVNWNSYLKIRCIKNIVKHLMLLKAEKGLCVQDDSSSTLIQAQWSPLLSYLSLYTAQEFLYSVHCTWCHFFIYLWYHHTVNEQALRFLVMIDNNTGDGVQWWRRVLSFSSLIYILCRLKFWTGESTNALHSKLAWFQC